MFFCRTNLFLKNYIRPSTNSEDDLLIQTAPQKVQSEIKKNYSFKHIAKVKSESGDFKVKPTLDAAIKKNCLFKPYINDELEQNLINQVTVMIFVV